MTHSPVTGSRVNPGGHSTGQLLEFGPKNPVDLFGLWSTMLPPSNGPAWLYPSSGTSIENTSSSPLPLSVAVTTQPTSPDVWLVLAVPQIIRVLGPRGMYAVTVSQ